MVSAKTKVINPQGLHMRPAQLFVTEMNKYKSGQHLDNSPLIPFSQLLLCLRLIS